MIAIISWVGVAKAAIYDECRIDQLAKMTFLSPSRLAHLFKQEMGQTIFAWREKQRVSRACELLRKTHFSVSQVALAVGYEDPLYFSRIFRQHLALSPRDYRKQYLSAGSLPEPQIKKDRIAAALR